MHLSKQISCKIYTPYAGAQGTTSSRNWKLTLKYRGRQKSGIYTIKYHNWPETPYEKVTKKQAGNHKAARNRQDRHNT